MLDLTVMSTPTLLSDWRAIIDHRVSHTEGSWMIRNIIHTVRWLFSSVTRAWSTCNARRRRLLQVNDGFQVTCVYLRGVRILNSLVCRHSAILLLCVSHKNVRCFFHRIWRRKPTASLIANLRQIRVKWMTSTFVWNYIHINTKNSSVKSDEASWSECQPFRLKWRSEDGFRHKNLKNAWELLDDSRQVDMDVNICFTNLFFHRESSWFHLDCLHGPCTWIGLNAVHWRCLFCFLLLIYFSRHRSVLHPLESKQSPEKTASRRCLKQLRQHVVIAGRRSRPSLQWASELRTGTSRFSAKSRYASYSIR